MKNVSPCFILTARIYCLSFRHQLTPLKAGESKYLNKNCQAGTANAPQVW